MRCNPLPPCTSTNPAASRSATNWRIFRGTALAAGSHAATALRRSDYTGALLSIGIGAAGVLLLEKLLSDKADTQEEASDE